MDFTQIIIKNSAGAIVRERKVAAQPSYTASFELTRTLRDYELQAGDTVTITAMTTDTPVNDKPAPAPVVPVAAPSTAPVGLPLGEPKDAK